MTSAWVDMFGGEVRYYRAGRIRTRCLEAGSGDPLLLLHGMGGHAEAYLKNIIPLAKQFHVYALDLIGHGLTDKPEIAYSIPDYMQHLVDFMDVAGIQRAHLEGESLSGWISAWLALEHPARVHKLILNTSAGLKLADQQPAAEAEAVARLRKLTSEAIANPTRESVRRRLEWLFRDPQASLTEELVEVRYRIYSHPDTQRALRTIVGQVTAQWREQYMLTPDRLKRIQVPTLVLWTRHNPSTPWQVAEQAHRLIPGSRFYVMEDCGHWPQWEKPDEFNGILMDFLAGSV